MEDIPISMDTVTPTDTPVHNNTTPNVNLTPIVITPDINEDSAANLKKSQLEGKPSAKNFGKDGCRVCGTKKYTNAGIASAAHNLVVCTNCGVVYSRGFIIREEDNRV